MRDDSHKGTAAASFGNTTLFASISDTGDVMPVPELTYFIHAVDGRSFAGWFRIVGAEQIEVLGVGLLQIVAYPAHIAPANAARQALARFVRARERKGLPVPAVDEIKAAAPSDAQPESEVR